MEATTKVIAAVSAETVAAVSTVHGATLYLSICAAYDLQPALAAGTRGAKADYARALVVATNHGIGEKHAAAIAMLAGKVFAKHGPDMASAAQVEGATRTSAAEAVAVIIKAKLAEGGYSLSKDDIGYYCDGAASQATQAAAAAEAIAKAKADEAEKLAKAELEKTNLQKQADETEAQAAQRIAKAEAEVKALREENEASETKRKESEDRAAQLKREQAQRDEAERVATLEREAAEAERAEAERKLAQSMLATIRVNADGSPDVVFALNPSPEALRAAADILMAAALDIEAKRAASMGSTATKRSGKRVVKDLAKLRDLVPA